MPEKDADRTTVRPEVEITDPTSARQAFNQLADTVDHLHKDTTERLEALKTQMRDENSEIRKRQDQIMELNGRESERKLMFDLAGQYCGSMPRMAPGGREYDNVDRVLKTMCPDGITADGKPKQGNFRAVQERADDYYLADWLFKQAREINPNARKFRDGARERLNDALENAGFKAMDTAESGGGSDWVPTGYSAALIEPLMLELRVASQFEQVDIPQGVGSYVLPLLSSGATGYKISESTDDITATTFPTFKTSQLSTASRTFTPVKCGALTFISYEFTEDSILPVLPIIKKYHAKGLGTAIESAVINGDDCVDANQDADVSKAWQFETAWEGLRFHTRTGLKKDCDTTLSTAKLQQGLSLGGKWTMRPDEVIIIPSVAAWWQMTTLDNLTTLDKIGERATLLTGQLGAFMGIPIIPSEKVRQDLSSVGTYDGITKSFTMIQVVNKNYWRFGMKHGIRLETPTFPLTQQIGCLATTRVDFKYTHDPDTTTAGNDYNVQFYDICSVWY